MEVFKGTAMDVSVKYNTSIKNIWRHEIGKIPLRDTWMIVSTAEKKPTYKKGNLKGLIPIDVELKVVADFKSNRFNGNDKALTKEYNITINGLNKILIKHGLRSIEDTFKYTKKEDIDKGKLGALYRAGWSVQKIAEEFVARKETIQEIIDEMQL